MAYRPTAENGAVYPACHKCAADNVPVYIVDPTSGMTGQRLMALQEGATEEEALECYVPPVLCQACASRLKAPLFEEFPWPPVV